MRPPDVKRPGNAVAAQPGRESGSLGRRAESKNTTKRDPADFPHLVEIDCFARRRFWARFRSAADADAEVVKLRRFGFDARVSS